MTVDNDETPDSFPAYDHAKEFYANYDIEEILGRGVSSTVRRCKEKKTGKEYAVKVCDLTVAVVDNGDVRMNVVDTTRNEVNILRMCNGQKHIVSIQEAFDSYSYMFVILELCPRGELFDYLTEVVVFNEKQTRQIMLQLFQAVEFLHSLNIVHRDIKPENILLASDMNIKLSDFGFAAVVDHDEQLTELLGTPGYLAPEVLKVSMYDNMPGYGRPVDMWACGVIMYTLLAGFPPFWHRKQVYMLRAIAECKYTFTSPEWDDISSQAKDLISRLLVLDPKKRLTASEALAHPFCRREDEGIQSIKRRLSVTSVDKKKLLLKEKKPPFKIYVLLVIGVLRLNQLRLRSPELSLKTLRNDPFRFRLTRKVIDGAAFKMYAHWVQRSDNQNRAALFANIVKRDVVTAMRSLSKACVAAV